MSDETRGNRARDDQPPIEAVAIERMTAWQEAQQFWLVAVCTLPLDRRRLRGCGWGVFLDLEMEYSSESGRFRSLERSISRTHRSGCRFAIPEMVWSRWGRTDGNGGRGRL